MFLLQAGRLVDMIPHVLRQYLQQAAEAMQPQRFALAQPIASLPCFSMINLRFYGDLRTNCRLEEALQPFCFEQEIKLQLFALSGTPWSKNPSCRTKTTEDRRKRNTFLLPASSPD